MPRASEKPWGERRCIGPDGVRVLVADLSFMHDKPV